METDHDLHMLRKHAAELAEHFDTVQIFTTRHDGERNLTLQFQAGSGNWYARYGGVKKWTNDEEANQDVSGDDGEDD